MANLGFYFDSTRCTGCRTCQVACKDKNRLDVGTLFRKVTTYSVGTYPDVKVFHFSSTCNHCENPACVANCPTGAMYKSEEGVVLHDDEVCIGCETCVQSCPYQVPVLLPEKNITGKCDSCYAIRKAGGNPACVDACLTRALDFGDLDELKSRHGEGLVSEIPVWPDGGTKPNVRIKAKEQALNPDAKIMIV